MDRTIRKKLGITLLAGVAAVGAGFVAIPGLAIPQADYLGLPTHPLTIAELGLAPIFTGFLLVALWRSLRGGADAITATNEPAAVDRPASIGVGLGLAALAGFGLVHFWFGVVPGQMAPYVPAAPTIDVGSRLIGAATLGAGTALFVALATLVSHRGIGDGFEVVVGAGLLYGLYPASRSFGDWLRSMNLHNLDVFGVFGNILVVSGVILATLWMLERMGPRVAGRERGREEAGSVGPPRLFDAPTAGIIPVAVVGGAMTLLHWVQIFSEGSLFALLRTRLTAPTVDGTPLFIAVEFVAVLGLGWLCSLWFNRRDHLGQALSMSFGLQTGDAGADSPIERDIARQRKVATLYSLGYLVLLLLAQKFGGELVRSIGVVPLAVGTAVVADFVTEWMAWHRNGDLAPAVSIHRANAVSAVERRLEREQIPYVVRGRRFRGMLRVFAPFVPATVLTRSSDVERVRRMFSTGDAETR